MKAELPPSHRRRAAGAGWRRGAAQSRLVDPFSKPLEWIPEESLALVESIRRWADEKVIPVRRLIDEDWESHEICRPLLEFLCVDLGYQWAAWPKEYGGGGINAVTSALCLEEMAPR